MRFVFLLCFITVFNLCSQAQKVQMGNYYYSYPEWDTSLSQNIKAQKIVSDSVFYCASLKKGHDSALSALLYFNTDGKLVEKDEFSITTKEVLKIVNYTYMNNLLVSEETVEKSNIIVNDNGGVRRDMKTFEYDSAGNTIGENDYSYYGDTVSRKSITTHKWQYDEQGHRTKEFVTLYNNPPYLYRVYNYENGALAEQKMFNYKQEWMYSYIFEQDKGSGTLSVYLLNTSKKLRNEFFYNNAKQLIKHKIYSDRDLYWDYSTNEYAYDNNGLVISQSFRPARGDGFYFTHLYTKN